MIQKIMMVRNFDFSFLLLLLFLLLLFTIINAPNTSNYLFIIFHTPTYIRYHGCRSSSSPPSTSYRSSHPIPSHPIPSHPIPSHPILHSLHYSHHSVVFFLQFIHSLLGTSQVLDDTFILSKWNKY